MQNLIKLVKLIGDYNKTHIHELYVSIKIFMKLFFNGVLGSRFKIASPQNLALTINLLTPDKSDFITRESKWVNVGQFMS